MPTTKTKKPRAPSITSLVAFIPTARAFAESWLRDGRLDDHVLVAIRAKLNELHPAYLGLMMSSDEQVVHKALPETVTVYRGCYEHNRDGLSWTLDRSIAAAFPSLGRYKHDGQPILLTGRARRERCVYFNDRDEQEILCASVEVVGVEALSADELRTALDEHAHRARAHLDAVLARPRNERAA